MSDFIEQRIIGAVKKHLIGRVNEIIGDLQEVIPVIEFGNYKNNSVVVPVITLAASEQTEKERIIKLDVYVLTVHFLFDDLLESELYCYAYSAAVEKAIKENPTLGGVADRATISGKKYQPPTSKNCNEGWSLKFTLRVTVENMHPCIFST